MPNNGHKWTEQEEQDAVDFPTYEMFRFFNPDITRDAYRIRRGILLREQAAAEAEAEAAPRRSRIRAAIHRIVCGD